MSPYSPRVSGLSRILFLWQYFAMQHFRLGAPELILILIILFFLFSARLFDEEKRAEFRKLGVSFYAGLAVLLALFAFAEFMLYWRAS